MKTSLLNLTKSVLWIAFLFMTGCSSSHPIDASPTAFTPTSTPEAVGEIGPTMLPLTGKIAFVDVDQVRDNHHVYVMNANGSELLDITPSNLPAIGNLSWSPDGEHLVFEAYKNGKDRIFKMKSDGSDLMQLTVEDRWGSRPSWSPDGEKIMFTSSSPDILGDSGKPVVQIYTMKSDGTEIRRFMVNTKADNTPMMGFYRKDGLISVSEPITRYAYTNYIVNLDGEIQKQFAEFASESAPVWSPDGKSYVASFPRSGCFGIIIKEPNAEHRCLAIGTRTNPPVYASSASWSPDGEYIIFSANLENDNTEARDIYIIRPDGSNLTRLTYLSRRAVGAVWSSK